MDTIYCMPCLHTLSPYPYGWAVAFLWHTRITAWWGPKDLSRVPARVVEVGLNPGAVSTAPWPPEKSRQRLNVWSRMPSQQSWIRGPIPNPMCCCNLDGCAPINREQGERFLQLGEGQLGRQIRVLMPEPRGSWTARSEGLREGLCPLQDCRAVSSWDPSCKVPALHPKAPTLAADFQGEEVTIQ